MEYKYRLQERKFSSNVIERGTPYKDENGREKIKWEVAVAPTLKSKDGDELADRILNMLRYE